jgi:hypothetical protein
MLDVDYNSNRIQKKLLILAPFSCISIVSFSAFILFKQLQKNHAISKVIIEHLEELLKKNPNNPIIQFLMSNKLVIINNIEKSYIADKINLWLILISVLFLITAIGWGVGLYQYDKYKNNYKSSEKIEKHKKEHALAFGITFFGTLTIVCLSLLIPFTMIIPKKLSTLLCKGIDAIEHKNNALVEVMKRIIETTFKEESLVLDIRDNISKWLTVFTIASAVTLIVFITLGCKYYFKSNDPQGRINTEVKQPDVDSNIKNDKQASDSIH